jgi:hypothetical protein
MAEHGKCGRAKTRYGIAIHPIHESKTVPHERIRLNNNGQEYHDFPLHRPTEVLSKPAKKGVLGSSSPPSVPRISYAVSYPDTDDPTR